MDYNSSQSRQSNGHDIQVNRTQSKPVAALNNKGKSRRSKKPLKILVAIMFVLFFIAGSLLLAIIMKGDSKDTSSLIKSEKYQAVFLDDQNGQVYFGKLKTLNQDYYQLSDIYYIRVENNQNKDAQQNISLAKLGNELHGPEDVMFISKDKVLFWENLKDDGKVVQSIKEYKKNGPTSNAPANTSTQGGTSDQSTSNGASTNTSAPATNNSSNSNTNTNTRR